MKCKICNNEVKNYIALGLHLKRVHNMTSKVYYDIYEKKENEGICPECGKETTFQGIRLGYLKFCCPTCAQLNKETRQKYKNTCLDKFGVENTFQAKECKEKAKQTNLKNLGVEYPQQSEKVQNKSAQTKQNLYGDKNYNNPIKAKTTCLNNWGVESYSQTNEFKEMLKEKVDYNKISKNGLITKQNNIQDKIDAGYFKLQDLFELYGESWYKNKIVPIEYVSGTGMVSKENVKIIKDYYESISGHSSQEETILYNIIQNNYSGKIIRGDYKVLNGKELDIYIPDEKIAFEYNGEYFHSNLLKDDFYHYNKSVLCLKKGIRLIHIYSFENWNDIEIFIYNLFNNSETITNDFNKFSPLQFNNKKYYLSGPKLLKETDRYKIFGSGTFTLE